jgi:tetratricopeptide (TPR) repeat protein
MMLSMRLLSTRNILIAVGVIVLALVGRELYIRSLAFHAPTQSAGNATSTATLITPDYGEPIAFSGSVSSSARSQLTGELAQIQANIRSNPLDLQAWESLGAVYKMGGDYAHAKQAWEYIITVSPSSPAPYSDLGDLYMNFLKDYPQAEKNYLKVVALRPQAVDAYRNLYTLYRYLYKTDTSAASDILNEGLKNNPGNAELLGLQQDLEAGK